MKTEREYEKEISDAYWKGYIKGRSSAFEQINEDLDRLAEKFGLSEISKMENKIEED